MARFYLVDGITGKTVYSFNMPPPDPEIASLLHSGTTKKHSSKTDYRKSRRYFIPEEDLGYDHTMVEAQMTCWDLKAQGLLQDPAEIVGSRPGEIGREINRRHREVLKRSMSRPD